MAGPPQPQNPAQGDAGDDSGPHKAQKHTNIPDAPSEKELRQILEEQEVGKFDFDRDFGVIKSEDDFEHRLWEYDRMMDDETKRPTDFPVDPKIQGLFVRKVAEAILNMEGATDKKIKDRKRSSKSWTTTTDSKTDVPANEDPGDKEKNSVAVSFLNGLKLTEVELLSWKIVLLSRDAQQGQLSRGTYGSQKTNITQFSSWIERFECIIECLKTTKTMARAIIREGDLRMKDFVADPKAKMDIINQNRMKNFQRAEERDAANKAKGAVLREEKRQSHSPFGAQNILAGTGSPQDETTPNSLESVNRRLSLPALRPRGSSKDKQGASRSSRAPTTSLPAVTSSPPSARKPLPPSARTPLPSSATQRPQTSGFPSFPGGASLQGGISGGPSTRDSAKKWSHLSYEPQEDYSPGTRGTGASRTQKRQRRDPSRGESDLNAYDMERHKDDNYDEEEEG